VFFFEKKNQKTFAPVAHPAHVEAGRVRQREKVFWFFFSKKNTSSSSARTRAVSLRPHANSFSG
jgi:hypothetical protein